MSMPMNKVALLEVKVLNIWLASDVFRDHVGACIHEQCLGCASAVSRTTRQPSHQSLEDSHAASLFLCLLRVVTILFAK